ncbi:Golgi-associated plant pathogenesis-related protein 1-like [Ixodes scapularis]|uniref:Golgi-associated plant pathogenesis-related protein 1-like n=1 Tax=Ixodes scapularis TaxID=6945 RepID=UPI001A9F50E6|nr:Golgi-associated plant pathogenesis-related protein 1-like [Ixodes scapularis]
MKISGFVLISTFVVTVVTAKSSPTTAHKIRMRSQRDTFQQECRQWHNYYRNMHHVPNLGLSRRLHENAQLWADHLARQRFFEPILHSPASREKFGENIYWYTIPSETYKVSAKSAIKLWYEEKKHYDYNHPRYSRQTSHFTQVIWKSSKTLGCAKSRAREGHLYRYFVVCNYHPKGNIHGEFKKNVLRP